MRKSILKDIALVSLVCLLPAFAALRLAEKEGL
jgi:hypothetical protein